MKLLGSLIALFAIAVVANGQCRISTGYATHSYVAPTYQTYAAATYVAPTYQSYATQILAVPVIVPAYGVGFGYGHGGYVDGDSAKTLRDEITSLRQEREFYKQLFLGNRNQPQAEQTPKPGTALPPKNDLPQQQAKAPTGAHPGLQVVSQKCSKCHDASTMAKHGNSLMLTTAGKQANVDAAAYKALSKSIFKGEPRMPPASEGGAKLTDEEGTAILDLYLQ